MCVREFFVVQWIVLKNLVQLVRLFCLWIKPSSLIKSSDHLLPSNPTSFAHQTVYYWTQDTSRLLWQSGSARNPDPKRWTEILNTTPTPNATKCYAPQNPTMRCETQSRTQTGQRWRFPSSDFTTFLPRTSLRNYILRSGNSSRMWYCSRTESQFAVERFQ